VPAESIPKDMSAWFGALYAGMDWDHRIETRCFARSKPAKRSFRQTTGDAALNTLDYSEEYDSYCGMALRGLGKGGGKDNCTATRIVWAELDIKHFDDDVAATLRRLDTFGLPLPIVVFTGGGFHVQVLLSELIDLRLPGMKDRVEAVNRHLAHALGGDVSPDGIWDLARILRPPCTLNHKYDPPRPVKLVRLEPDRCYALEELESWLRQHYPLPQPQSAGRPERPEPEHGHGHGSAATLRQGRGADSGCGWLERPGDAYNARTTWATLLEPLGWTALFKRDGVTFWRRPGKGHGHGATTNHGGADCLHVFTSSARPLEANRNYTRFGVYAALHHNDDLLAAGWALYEEGYGALDPDAYEYVFTPCPTAPPELRERAGRGRIKRATLALLDSTGPAGYRSAPQADAAIAAGLIGAGLTGDEALSLLLHSVRGQDARERKGQRYGLTYWQHTVARAVELVEPVSIVHSSARVLATPARPRGVPLPAPQRPHGVPLAPPVYASGVPLEEVMR
jgi:hypothetical protein